MCHLFGEGNDLFREGDWTKSIEMYTEALNITEYADSEDICIPAGLLEKLYANRAAAYLNIVPVSRRGLTKWQSLDSWQAALRSNRLLVNWAWLHSCVFSGKCISDTTFSAHLIHTVGQLTGLSMCILIIILLYTSIWTKPNITFTT